jgi:tetratricopeptide (TPR) repeat protein
MDTALTLFHRITAVALALMVTSLAVDAAEIAMPQAAPCNCLGADKEAEMLRLLKQDQKLWGANSNEVVRRHALLANFYARRSELPKSDEQIKQALAISDKLKIQKYRSDVLLQQAKNRMAEARYSDAEHAAKEALLFTKSNKQRADILAVLGWSLGEQKHYTESISNYEQAMTLRRKSAGDAEEMAMQMMQLASIYQKAAKMDKAVETLQSAVNILSKAKGESNPFTQYCRQLLTTWKGAK